MADENENEAFDALLDAQIAGDTPAEQPPEAAAATIDPPAGEQTPPAEADPAAPEAKKWPGMDKVGELPKRLYTEHFTPVQKETMRLMAEMPNIDPAEVVVLAKRNLGMEAEPAEGDPAAAPTELPAPDAVSEPVTLEDFDAAIADVDRALDEHADADGVGTTFNREIKTLLDQKQDLIMRRAMARQTAANAAVQAADSFTTRNQRAVETSLARYEALNDESSPLHTAVMARYAEYENLARLAQADPAIARDPDTQLALVKYEHPDFALLLADEVAGEMGIAATPKAGRPNATSTQGGPPAHSTAPTPKAGIAPLPGNAGAAHRVTIAPSDPLARFQVAAQSGDEDALDAALDGLISGGAGERVNHATGNGRLVFMN